MKKLLCLFLMLFCGSLFAASPSFQQMTNYAVQKTNGQAFSGDAVSADFGFYSLLKSETIRVNWDTNSLTDSSEVQRLNWESGTLFGPWNLTGPSNNITGLLVFGNASSNLIISPYGVNFFSYTNSGGNYVTMTRSGTLSISSGLNTPVLAGSSIAGITMNSSNLTTAGTITAANLRATGNVQSTNGYGFASGYFITNMYTTNVPLDFPSTALGSVAILTVDLTPAIIDSGDTIIVNPPKVDAVIGSFDASATNGLISVKFIPTGLSDPPIGNYRITVFKTR